MRRMFGHLDFTFACLNVMVFTISLTYQSSIINPMLS